MNGPAGRFAHSRFASRRRHTERRVDSSAPSAANFAVNPSDAKLARLWIDISFTGGTSPTLDFTPYLKPHAQTAPIGEGEPVEYDNADGLPDGTFVVDVDVEGCDLFVYVDNESGSPSSWEVTVSIVWI